MSLLCASRRFWFFFVFVIFFCRSFAGALTFAVDLKNRGGTSFNSEKLSLEGVSNRGVDYKCRILPIDSGVV